MIQSKQDLVFFLTTESKSFKYYLDGGFRNYLLANPG